MRSVRCQAGGGICSDAHPKITKSPNHPHKSGAFGEPEGQGWPSNWLVQAHRISKTKKDTKAIGEAN
jgi:hypothetical protein